jgi:hypothetical protein
LLEPVSLIAGFEFERLTLNRVGSAGRGSLPALLFILIFACATSPHALSASDESEPLVVLEFLNHFDWSDMELSCVAESPDYAGFQSFRLRGLEQLVVRGPGGDAGATVNPKCKVKRNHAAYCSWSDGLTQYGLSLTPGETRAYRSGDGRWTHVVPGVISKSFTAKSVVACTALVAEGAPGG